MNRYKIKIPTKQQIYAAIYTASPVQKKILILFCLSLVISGIGFLISFNNLLLVTVPREGGSITEGIVGSPNFINPLFATTDSDKDVVQLVYAGLMRRNQSGNLIPALAREYEISDDGLQYTFRLHENLKWSDGFPITSDDVSFTISAAINPTTRSIQRPNWEGIKTEIFDEHTIQFTLKKPYAPFLANTTIGIIPKHIWAKFIPEELIGAHTNEENIIGAGPYKIDSIKKKSSGAIDHITLTPNKYFVLGKPFIKKVELRFFNTEKSMIEAFHERSIDAIGSSQKIVAQKSITGSKVYTIALPRIFAVFFNGNFVNRALQDINVRSALSMSVDRQNLIEILTSTATSADGSFNIEEANALLEKTGWKINTESGIREKVFSSGGKKITEKLEFDLVTAENPELEQIAQFLQKSWGTVGARANIKVFPISALDEAVFGPRKYDAVLFGEVVGLDPDPYAFWHSSQRLSPGLNIALYANKTVDSITERIRETRDLKTRMELFTKLEKEISNDIPAIFLYIPMYTYAVPSNIKNYEKTALGYPAERFDMIHAWFIKTQKIWKFLIK